MLQKKKGKEREFINKNKNKNKIAWLQVCFLGDVRVI